MSRRIPPCSGHYHFPPAAQIEITPAGPNYERNSIVELAISTSRSNFALNRAYLTVKKALQSLESRLNPKKFVRIHRSSIVNLEFVNEFEPISSGDYRVSLRSGTQLTLSRSFRHKLHPSPPC